MVLPRSWSDLQSEETRLKPALRQRGREWGHGCAFAGVLAVDNGGGYWMEAVTQARAKTCQWLAS